MTEADTTTFTLPPDVCATIDDYLSRFPAEQRRSGILFALRTAQEWHGWLPEALMDTVAEYLNVPKIWVYEVATFYSMYNLKPCGRHKVGVCMSISCALRGSKKIAEHIQARYGVGFGETTADDKFSLQEVECMAACNAAPMLIVDDKHYHENLTPEKVDAILQELE